MKKFGMRQAERYQQLILSCLVKLRAGPSVPGARQLKGFDVPIYELRMAGRGRPARHVLFYTPADKREIQVLRILHDSMDFARHLGGVEQ